MRTSTIFLANPLLIKAHHDTHSPVSEKTNLKKMISQYLDSFLRYLFPQKNAGKAIFWTKHHLPPTALGRSPTTKVLNRDWWSSGAPRRLSLVELFASERESKKMVGIKEVVFFGGGWLTEKIVRLLFCYIIWGCNFLGGFCFVLFWGCFFLPCFSHWLA